MSERTGKYAVPKITLVNSFGLLSLCFALFGCAGRNAAIAGTGTGAGTNAGADIDVAVSPSLHESRILELNVPSAYGRKATHCKVYLPKGYGSDRANRKYPVLYALNGYGSDEDMWVDAGLAASADDLIEAGDIEPLILVFVRTSAVTLEELKKYPDGRGRLGEQNMDLAICKEVVPSIDRRFSTVKERTGRFVCGFSMGGMVALRIALRHPDTFGKVAGYSPAVLDADFSGDQLEEWLYPKRRHGTAGKIYATGKRGEIGDGSGARASDERTGHGTLAVYLDAGSVDDPFYQRVLSLHEALLARGIASEFHPYEGGHSLSHNKGDFGEYLRFFVPARGR